jgi:hypothetical protein
LENFSLPQLIVAALGVMLGSNGAVAIALTLYFNRKLNAAQAGKLRAEQHNTDADTLNSYREQVDHSLQRLVEFMPKLEQSNEALNICRREKVDAEIAKREAEAEKERMTALAESLRLQVEALQNRETELLGELRGKKV